MKFSQVLLLASLTLAAASCVDQDLDQGDVSATSDELTSRGVTTQSACVARTPTSWWVNGAMCTHPWPGSYPLEIGETVRIESFQGGGGYIDVYCDEGGLRHTAEVCSGTCELCL